MIKVPVGLKNLAIFFLSGLVMALVVTELGGALFSSVWPRAYMFIRFIPPVLAILIGWKWRVNRRKSEASRRLACLDFSTMLGVLAYWVYMLGRAR
jgi:hypothetical protein